MSLDPDYRGGRPRKTTPVQRDRIVSIARARPDTQSVALTRRPLPKLCAHLAGMGIVLSQETLRQTLIGAGSRTSAPVRGNGARTLTTRRKPSGCSASIVRRLRVEWWSVLMRWDRSN